MAAMREDGQGVRGVVLQVQKVETGNRSLLPCAHPPHSHSLLSLLSPCFARLSFSSLPPSLPFPLPFPLPHSLIACCHLPHLSPSPHVRSFASVLVPVFARVSLRKMKEERGGRLAFPPSPNPLPSRTPVLPLPAPKFSSCPLTPRERVSVCV